MRGYVAIVLLLLLASPTSSTEFYNFNEWNNLPNLSLEQLYIAGMMDAIFIYDINRTVQFERCLSDRHVELGALTANVRTFVRERPELHTLPMLSSVLSYLTMFCRPYLEKK